MLVHKGCCDYCDAMPLDVFTVANQDHQDDVIRVACEAGAACSCGVPYVDPHFVAVCRFDRCEAADVRNDAISACAADSDCRLRWGLGTSEPCADQGSPPAATLYAVAVMCCA